MPNPRSFTEYVGGRFYNELCDAVTDVIEEKQDALDLNLRNVHTIDSIEVTDVEVKHVWVNDLPGMEIEFDVAVCAELYVHERDYHYDESETAYKWFMVSFRGDLEKELDDVTVTGKDIYNGKGRYQNPLDDALVPVIKPEQLEKVAEQFLRDYYPKALLQPMWLEPTELAGELGLKVIRKRITKDGDIFALFKGISAETAETEVSSIILNGIADYNGSNHVEGEPGTENAYEDTPWHAQWKNLPVYGTDGGRLTYIVKETVTYDGYTVSYEKLHGIEGDIDKDYALNNEVITNTEPRYDFDILKVCEGTAKPLPEASFTIRPIEPTSTTSEVAYVSGSEESDPVKTGDDGKTRFQGITPGYYEVRETVPPTGYVLTSGATFYIKIETTGIKLLEKEIVDGKLSFKEAQTAKVGNVTISTEGTTVMFTVENTPGAALPNTGGPGTWLFTILGSILILGAGVLLWRRRRIV